MPLVVLLFLFQTPQNDNEGTDSTSSQLALYDCFGKSFCLLIDFKSTVTFIICHLNTQFCRFHET